MLARFYKLSLKKGVRIVRIADEIEHIRLYVGLQNKLYENAIALHIDVPESHLDCACIKILLQPIVENSILHGIMERETIQGNVWLQSHLDENDLVISVRDDGIGIDPEIMDVLNQRTNWMDENGYGIKNTMDRITLCYGSKYGIRYESEPGKRDDGVHPNPVHSLHGRNAEHYETEKIAWAGFSPPASQERHGA